MINLTVEKRDSSAKLKDIRAKGFIPAVFYGHKQESTSISVKEIDFLKVWKEAGESSIIHLTGNDIDQEVLIQDIDLDPVTEKVRHADFYVIEKGKKVKVHIPLEFDGVAPAVKDLGGILIKVLHEVEIEAMPKDLPHNLIVDIAPLVTLQDKILAKDIVLPAGVVLITKADEIIASVSEVKEEVVEAAPVDLSAIEVEKKGKEAKEGEVPISEAKPKEAPAK